MIISRRKLYSGFIYKISVLRDYKVKINRWTRTISFNDSEQALRCYEEMKSHVPGISMSLDKEKMKLSIPRKLVVPLD